jgi:hypothetical protein
MPLFASVVILGEPTPPEARVPISALSHAAFDALLTRFVDERGRVAYAEWKADVAAVEALHSYLTALGRADLGVPVAQATALSFWINTYNALTLAGVLRVYPTASVRDHTGRVFGFNIWKHLRLHIGGTTLSLSEIEHGVLRALNDPRVHFALVCASNGCPALPRRAYTPSAVDEQLERSATEFLSRPDAVRFDPDRQTVSLSRLFKWYGADFAATPAEQLAALRRFRPASPEWEHLNGDEVRIEYLPYDWKLNDRSGDS